MNWLPRQGLSKPSWTKRKQKRHWTARPSPAPTTPTPPDDAAGLEAANAAFVRKLLAALVGHRRKFWRPLNELAAALGNDPNFATTITNALAGKQPLNDVLTAISALTQRDIILLYFNTDGNASLFRRQSRLRIAGVSHGW